MLSLKCVLGCSAYFSINPKIFITRFEILTALKLSNLAELFKTLKLEKDQNQDLAHYQNQDLDKNLDQDLDQDLDQGCRFCRQIGKIQGPKIIQF